MPRTSSGRGPLRAVAEDHAPCGRHGPDRPRASRARSPAPASRGCAGRRRPRAACPSPACAARAARELALEHGHLPPTPPARRRSACIREKQNAPCGTRRQSALHRVTDPAADRPEVLGPVLRRSRPRASPRRSGTWRRAAPRPPPAGRRTETRPCGPRRTGARGPAGGPAPRGRTPAAGAPSAARRRCTTPAAARPRPPALRPRRRSRPRRHCRSVRYVTSCPSAARRSARLRYHRSAPPTVCG